MNYLAAAAVLAACLTTVSAQEIKGQFERTLTVSGTADLDILTDSGGISVKPGAAGSVQIRGFLTGHNRGDSQDVERRIRTLEQNPPIEQAGSKLRIGYVKDKDLLHNVSMRFEILAPPDSKVRARADSGGIHVEGVKGPAECHVDSGGIEIENVGSDVRASADSGGIRIRNVQGPVSANADSGGIEVSGVAGSVDVTSDSGGVQVAQTAAAPVRIRADSGGARVKLAPGAGYDISAGADSGRITILPEMTLQGTISPNRAQGKVRGGGPLVDVRVDSGNIHIE
jgi:Putative adhesin